MKVGHDLGVPFLVYLNAAHGFGLGHPEPVAVHVKQVVVVSSAGPGLIMFRGLGIGIRPSANPLGEIIDKPFPAVWILGRINDGDAVIQDIFDYLVIAGCQQVIDGQES